MQVFDIPMTNDLQEITHHGSNRFPIAIYTTVIKENVYGYVPLHWHEEIQFVVVTKGVVKFTVDREDIVIHKGQGIFVNSGRLHSARSLNCEDGTFLCLDIHPEFIATKESLIYSKYIDPVLTAKYLPFVEFTGELEWHDNLLGLTTELSQLIDSKEKYYELRIMKAVMDLWSIFVENLQFDAVVLDALVEGENQRIKAILEYVESNYDRNITLEELSEVANISRSECCRSFKRVVGSTPFEYINKTRVSKSMQLLRASEMLITEIAHEVGFASSSYFISTFKKTVGCTPTKFRKQFLKQY